MKIFHVVISTLFLTSCQQGAGYNQNQNTYKGAGIGAIVGGIAGALSDDDDRLKNAAIGAGIGSLAGSGVGQYMDRQEKAMRGATQGTGIDIQRQGNDILLNMPSNVTFNVNQSEIDSSLYPTLNNIAQILRDYPNTILEITGHTDSSGDDSYNYALSDKRAKAVASYLMNRGVYQKIISTGMGESNPIASNETTQGKAQNRRVELKISPISS